MDINNPRLTPGKDTRSEARKGKTNEGQAILKLKIGKLDVVAGEKYIPFQTVIDHFHFRL